MSVSKNTFVPGAAADTATTYEEMARQLREHALAVYGLPNDPPPDLADVLVSEPTYASTFAALRQFVERRAGPVHLDPGFLIQPLDDPGVFEPEELPPCP